MTRRERQAEQSRIREKGSGIRIDLLVANDHEGE